LEFATLEASARRGNGYLPARSKGNWFVETHVAPKRNKPSLVRASRMARH
jgi:hypothetical protein